MEDFNKKRFQRGFILLFATIFVPLLLFLGVLTWGLGVVFILNLFLFLIGKLTIANTFKTIGANDPLFLLFSKLPTPKNAAYIRLLVLITFVFALVWALTFLLGTTISLLVFGCYALAGLIYRRCIKTWLLLYVRSLRTDRFDYNYWITNSYTPYNQYWDRVFKYWLDKISPTLSWKVRVPLFYKKANEEQQLKAFEILLSKKFYQSVLQFQKQSIIHYSSIRLHPKLCARLFDSIPQTHRLWQKEKPDLAKKQLKVLQLNNYWGFSHLYLVKSKYFLPFWFQKAQEDRLHQAFIQAFFEPMIEQMNRFISQPTTRGFSKSVLDFIKSPMAVQRAEQLLEQHPFEADSPISTTINSWCSLLFTCHGIAHNINF